MCQKLCKGILLQHRQGRLIILAHRSGWEENIQQAAISGR